MEYAFHNLTISQAPELARAYEEACRTLGIEPSPPSTDEQTPVREKLAKAIINAAKLGVSDRGLLSNLAVAFGTGDCRS